MMKTKRPIIAAIDIGTNSAHLVLAELEDHTHIHIIDSHKIILKLGQWIDPKTRILNPEGVEKTIVAMRQMKDIATVYSPIFRVVATHAMRIAKNHDHIFAAIYKATGIKVELIDGLEEARLSTLGMQIGLSLESKTFLGVDIGGGSTELTLCQKDNIKYATSVQLGAVMLSLQFFSNQNFLKRDIDELQKYIAMRIAPFRNELGLLRFDCAVICAGVAKALSTILIHESPEKSPDLNGYILSSQELFKLNAKIQALRTPEALRNEWGLDTNRSEIILAGAAILVHLTHIMGIKQWILSTSGLREGLLADSASRLTKEGDRPNLIQNARLKSLQHMSSKFRVDESQAQRVSDLALQMYDKLLPEFSHLSYEDSFFLSNRELLKAAAWLHECGKFISFPGYHRHSMYLITHCKLMGFSYREQHLIALIVRYHRKGRPSSKRHECKDLSLREITTLNFLSGILRLAVAANRTRHGLIQNIRTLSEHDKVIFILETAKKQSLEVELTKMDQEKSKLEKVLDRPIEIKAWKNSL